MRSHQAASWLSSAREKWTRPRVVGPSPVITPSRTTASACAAVFRQEILEGSKATSETSDGSGRAASGADIGSYSFQLLYRLVLGQQFHAGVNEWLMIRNSHREFFRWLPISRDRERGVHPARVRPWVHRCRAA